MHTPIRVLIVDDEPLGRARIRELLARAPDVQVVGECVDGVQALQVMEAAAPELIFLDVRMPALDGLGVVEAIDPRRCPQIVFVTAYDAYMERAFELHALDYLRKPFTDARFFDALEHARRRVMERRGAEDVRAAVREILAEIGAGEPTEGSRLALRDADGVGYRVISTREIEWLESHERRVRVHIGAETLTWRANLARAERMLDPGTFLRIHRRLIVNTARIRRIDPLWKGEYTMIMESGKVLGTGRGYRAAVERLIGGTWV